MSTPQILSILNNARSALVATQTAVQTVSQNVANAGTEGYSRRRVDLVAGPSYRQAGLIIGSGVHVRDIARAQDVFADHAVRRQSAIARYQATAYDGMSMVERILNEPSESALSATMDAFSGAWKDLADHPQSDVARGVVRLRGQQVAQLLNTYDAQIVAHDRSLQERINVAVKDVNNIAQAIAQLNRDIQAVEASGLTAADLRDQRDLLVDKIGGYANVTIEEQPNHTYTVRLGTATIVDQTTARQLVSFDAIPPALVSVAFADAPAKPLTNLGGSIGALVDLRNTTIRDTRARLDALAQGLVETVNSIHQTGAIYPDGWAPPAPVPPAGAFFDATGTTAATIKLDTTVAASAENVVASLPGTGPTNNAVAAKLAQATTLAQAPAAGPPLVPAYGVNWGGEYVSAREFYRDTVTSLGLAASGAEREATAAESLEAQAATRRESLRGVNLDEEMVSLIKFQQAYAAAGRLVSVADQMAQTILEMTA